MYIKVFCLFQIIFKVLFDLEARFEYFCLCYAAYIQRGLHKFELLVAVGSPIRLILRCYETQFSYIQELRVVSLIKMSPVTDEFVFKVRTWCIFLILDTILIYDCNLLRNLPFSLYSLNLFAEIPF